MTEEYIHNVCENLDELVYVVYVLRSRSNPNMMYCGMTNNIKGRLRQHNGHIKGGGKYTSANRPWHLAAVIPISGSSDNKSLALKVEYWTKAKNYPLQGFEGEDYRRPPRKEIPTTGPVERRAWLLRETIRKHSLSEPLWFDAEMRQSWNQL